MMEVHNKVICPGHSIAVLVAATILLLFMWCPQTAASVAANKLPPRPCVNNVKSSCEATTQPTLCIKTLAPYASEVKTNSVRLCKVALHIAMKAAINASHTMSKVVAQKCITPIEADLIKQCIDWMEDSAHHLKTTIAAVGYLADDDWEIQWGNARTWVSGALTNTDTCMDVISGGKVRANVKNKTSSIVLYVAGLTCNALELIALLY